MTKFELPRMRSARVRTVVEVVVREGNGTAQDVFREVTYFYGDDGELLAKRDAWTERQQAA